MLERRLVILVSAVIVINTGMAYLPEDLLFPIGEFYNGLAARFADGSYFHRLFSVAAGRYLFPDYAYFIGDAVCYVLVAYYVRYTARGMVQVVSPLLMWLTYSNLLDELIFNPRRFEWNEVVMLGIGLLFAWLKYRDQKR